MGQTRESSAHVQRAKRRRGARKSGVSTLGARFLGDFPAEVMPLVILVSLFLLTGCASATTYMVPKAILLAVLSGLKAKKKLQFASGEQLAAGETQKLEPALVADRHKGWFIFRRTELIGARHSSFKEAELSPLVEAQYDKVEAFVISKIGTGAPLEGYAEPGGTSLATSAQAFTYSPNHHFDLQNLAISLVNGTSNGLEAQYLEQRRKTIIAVVWHAAGSHDTLWSNNGDGAVLNEKALSDVLDRRLRTVERMLLQINGGGNERTAPTHNGRGPWSDESRVRVFEYPDFEIALLDPADIGVIWADFSTELKAYVANVPGFTGALSTRFNPEPTSLSPDWHPFTNDAYNRFAATTGIAAALDRLLQSQLNIWDRNWLFCDHSIAAAQLEALRFSMLRNRPGEDFDTLVGPKGPVIGALLGGSPTFDSQGKPQSADLDSLWNDGVFTGPGDTGVFDNAFIEYRDLQVGDHVILWNHHLYVSLTTGVWRLENALVTDMDVVTTNWDEKDGRKIDPATFMKSDQRKLGFSGFGGTNAYPGFQQDLLDNISNSFANVQQKATTEPGPFFVIAASYAQSFAVQWDVYSSGIVGKAWFIFLPRITPGDGGSPWPNIQRMHDVIKQSVIDDSGRGSGYNAPPTSLGGRNLSDGVFFPLFVPVVDDAHEMSWDRYFQLRKSNSGLVATLAPATLSAGDIPGLFIEGQEQPIQTIRPRARP